MKRRLKKKLGRTVAPVFTIILTPNGSKKAWPPRKTPQNDGYVYISLICMSVNQQTVPNIRGEEKEDEE